MLSALTAVKETRGLTPLWSRIIFTGKNRSPFRSPFSCKIITRLPFFAEIYCLLSIILNIKANIFFHPPLEELWRHHCFPPVSATANLNFLCASISPQTFTSTNYIRWRDSINVNVGERKGLWEKMNLKQVSLFRNFLWNAPPCPGPRPLVDRFTVYLFALN